MVRTRPGNYRGSFTLHEIELSNQAEKLSVDLGRIRKRSVKP